jgi:hypothetical protein
VLCITGICNYWKRIGRNNQINNLFFSRTQKSNFRKRNMSIIFLPLVSTTYQCWESSSKGVIVVSKSILLCLITSVRNTFLHYYTCYNLGLPRMFYIVSINIPFIITTMSGFRIRSCNYRRLRNIHRLHAYVTFLFHITFLQRLMECNPRSTIKSWLLFKVRFYPYR